MNYNYSQMNEIIEKQYAKKKGDKNNIHRSYISFAHSFA